ncbi:TylF/MycF/NovP-related O-methyltransferase [Chloroflexota bacterium]
MWLFDSWEGLPEPNERDVSYNLEPGRKGMALGFEFRAREMIFEKLRLDSKRVHLVKGWFADTLPVYKKDLGTIALLHLDCDWYESVKLCLEQLYDSIVSGGFIVIDDYGYWGGCREAVHEFIE